MEQEEELNRQ